MEHGYTTLTCVERGRGKVTTWILVGNVAQMMSYERRKHEGDVGHPEATSKKHSG